MNMSYLRYFRFIPLMVFFALFAGFTTSAQKKFEVRKVDFDLIKKNTYNPKAAFFYPKLIEQFKSNDTVMTLEAYRALYYGYIYQEDYNPFRESKYSKMVEDLYYKQPHTRAECDSIEKYAELSLDDNLFDFNQMEYYIYALKQKKKYARAAVRQYRLDRLIAAIMSSGRGTETEPWVVISPEHEYNIINFLGYIATDHKEAIPNKLDCIQAKPAEGVEGRERSFYFDVSLMMEQAAIKFPDVE